MFSSNTTQVSQDAVFIEDVFQTWLYTGNGTTQTINNGIDLAGKGGMVWGKTRDAVVAHTITDTVRGVDKEIFPNLTDAQQTRATGTGSVFAFNSNGFSTSGVNGFINYSGLLEVAWTFREAPKFFDVVTYTGNGVAGRQIAHSLGSVPGVMIVKRTDASGQWPVYHRSTSGTPQNDYLLLNQTAGAYINQDLIWNNTAPTSTVFTVGSNSAVNANGGTYVAYLFAHNAGGFGLSGTDNVISCGSFTTDGSGNATINLGYEPQWVLSKSSAVTGSWDISDVMRGMSFTPDRQLLFPNLSSAEGGTSALFTPTATGFNVVNSNSNRAFIYIAIRRGPMKVPTTGTSVFTPVARAGTGTDTTTNAGFPVDFGLTANRTAVTDKFYAVDRLRGNRFLRTNLTSAESTNAALYPDNPFDVQSALKIQGTSSNNGVNQSGFTYIDYLTRRAPVFMDVCCYTGNGSTQTIDHNLNAVPEIVLFKRRNSVVAWQFFTQFNVSNCQQLILNSADAATSSSYNSGNSFASRPTSTSTLSLGSESNTNASGGTYVAYLFATCPGVSKVGSYTGNDVSGRIIDCGFTGGARFVLLKCTSQSGDWFVWDSARGITSGNDPYLLLNSTAAEETGTNYVDTHATGFRLNAFNSTGDQFTFLAIA